MDTEEACELLEKTLTAMKLIRAVSKNRIEAWTKALEACPEKGHLGQHTSKSEVCICYTSSKLSTVAKKAEIAVENLFRELAK